MSFELQCNWLAWFHFITLQQNFIAVGEIDPLNRRHSTDKRPDVVVQGSYTLFSHLIHIAMLSKMHLHLSKILIHFPASSFTEPLQFIAINKCYMYKLETFILNHSNNDNCITLVLWNLLSCSKILQLYNDNKWRNGKLFQKIRWCNFMVLMFSFKKKLILILLSCFAFKISVSLLAEDELVRTQLRSLDVPVQVTQHLHPIQVLPARTLSSMYQQLGKNRHCVQFSLWMRINLIILKSLLTSPCLKMLSIT